VTGTEARLRLPRWLVRRSLRHPRTVLAVWVSVLVLAWGGVRLLRVDTSTDSVLDRTSPSWSFYQESLRRFGGDEVIVVAFESESPFEPAALRRVEEATRAISAVPGIRRVDSLSSVPLIEVDTEGTVRIEPPLSTALPTTAEDRRLFRDRVLRDRIAPGVLTSSDGRMLAVNALLDRDVEGRFESIVAEIRRIVGKEGALISGVPVFRTEINIHTASEITFFVLATITIIALYLYLIFRTAIAVVIPLAAGGAGTWVLLAIMGAAGTPLSLTTMILPSIMLALGCANVMHVMTSAVGVIGRDSLEKALDPILLPIMLSGLTTTIGFLAVSGVPIDAIQAIGSYGAAGVLTILGATVTAVPAALTIWPLPGRDVALASWIRRRLCPWLVDIAERRRLILLGSWALLGVVCMVGLSRLDIETDATTWFPRGSEVRESYERIRERLSGISPVNVVIESDGRRPVTSVDALEAVAKFTEYLDSMPEVGRAIAVTDPLGQLDSGITGTSTFGLPKSREQVEQYLLLLESVEQLPDLITADRSATNILLRVNNNGSDDLQRMAQSAEAWWNKHGPAGFSARSTGIMYEFARAEDQIAIGQLRGFGLAMLSVGIILVAILRHVRLAAVTLIANAFPMLIAFGGMGLLGLPLDAGTVVVGNLAIGMAIDETLHLVSGVSEQRSSEASRREVILRALNQSVPAILYTTGAIVLGFSVLAFSEFSFTRNLGVLTATVVVLCLLADVLLLPPLLGRGWRRHPD